MLLLTALLASSCAIGTGVSLPHQAPGLEALLPAKVAGRQLAIWSMRGDRWLAMQTDPDIQSRIQALLDANGDPTADFAVLRYAVGERSNTQDDPPYLIHVTWRPSNAVQEQLAALLFTGSVRFQPGFGLQTSSFAAQQIGGKQVRVGKPEMLVQDEEQHGRPYLYETTVGTDALLFAVVTDNEAWAAEVLGALP